LFSRVSVVALDSHGKLVAAMPSAIAESGVRQTFRIRTRLGRELTATSNHPLLTFQGWKPVEDLAPGDRIAVPRVLRVEGTGQMRDGEVALLAYLIGDGSVTGGVPSFTNANASVVADVKKWADDLGAEVTSSPESLSYRFRRRRTTPQLDLAASLGVSSAAVSLAMRRKSVSAGLQERVAAAAATTDYRYRAARVNPVRELLERTGLWGCDAHSKHVPEVIFGLPNSQIALFLNRLYATDGSAWVSDHSYRVEYVSVSHRLARDVQHLLLRFGIVAKVRRRKIEYSGQQRTAYEVAIQDPTSVQLFASLIGIFSKEAQLEKVVAMARSRRRANAHSDRLPVEIWDLVTEEMGSRRWADVSAATGRPRNHNWHVGNRSPYRGTVSELARALESTALEEVAQSDVAWDSIVSIEASEETMTYDLQVPGVENFVADDVVVHNSALTLNMATNIAKTGKVVALFSLEMAKEEVVQRILCSVGKVESTKLRTGQVGNQWDRLVSAANQMFRTPIYVDDSSVVTVTDIRAKCRRLKRVHGLDMVVVDYVQLMQGSSKENRQQEIAEISRGLKNLARELEVPIIAVSQLNRSVEQREDRRPRLSDLRESGALEQDADVVMFIYRHEYYHPEDIEKRGTAEVIVAKHRAGATGTVEMTFMPDFTRFADLGRDLA
jgi:replicative DNA helicase